MPKTDAAPDLHEFASAEEALGVLAPVLRRLSGPGAGALLGATGKPVEVKDAVVYASFHDPTRMMAARAWLTAGIEWARARGWSYTIEDCEPASPEEAAWRKAREDERLALVRYATEGVLADATRQATADAVRRDLVAAQKAAAGAGRRYKTACHVLALAMNADRAQEARP